jgi:hypothetical protein
MMQEAEMGQGDRSSPECGTRRAYAELDSDEHLVAVASVIPYLDDSIRLLTYLHPIITTAVTTAVSPSLLWQLLSSYIRQAALCPSASTHCVPTS